LRIAGFLLMLAGWMLVLAALVMLVSLPSRTGFVLAGLAVEILGFVLVVRAHLPSKAGEK
jgi:hypothetical protein